MQQIGNVVFVELPIEGQPARIIVNGQRVTTSPVTVIHRHPNNPSAYWVQTSSGSVYQGQVQAQNQTVMGWVPPQTQQSNLHVPIPGMISSAVSNNHIPRSVTSRLNWGAFFLPLLWSISHRVWIGVISIIPVVHLVMSLILLIKGNEWALDNRQFSSLADFNRVQTLWCIAGIIIFFVPVILALLIFVIIPLFGIIISA